MWHLSAFPKRRYLVAIGLFLYLINPPLSVAECSLTFVPIEESKYLLQGSGCEDVAALAFTVDYDTAYLFSPEVTVMGGGLVEEDRGASAPPGKLQLHILNQDHSDVLEATVFFQKRGEYPAVINCVTAELADLSGAVSPVQVQMAAPVNLPQEEEIAAATESADDVASTSQEKDLELLVAGEPDVPPAVSAPAALPPRSKAVFERFRDFNGVKSLAAFEKLFYGVAPCCRQTPAILIADGRQTARVVLDGVEAAGGPPSITVSGGRLVSAKRGGNNEEWVVVVQPYRNLWDVRLSASFANAVVDFPLTVATPIEIPRRKLAQIKDKNYLPRLRSFVAGNKALAKYPVWLREYLYTANYLAAREIPGK